MFRIRVVDEKGVWKPDSKEIQIEAEGADELIGQLEEMLTLEGGYSPCADCGVLFPEDDLDEDKCENCIEEDESDD